MFALHPNFVRVTGSAADFKINYTSVVSICVAETKRKSNARGCSFRSAD